MSFSVRAVTSPTVLLCRLREGLRVTSSTLLPCVPSLFPSLCFTLKSSCCARLALHSCAPFLDFCRVALITGCVLASQRCLGRRSPYCPTELPVKNPSWHPNPGALKSTHLRSQVEQDPGGGEESVFLTAWQGPLTAFDPSQLRTGVLRWLSMCSLPAQGAAVA